MTVRNVLFLLSMLFFNCPLFAQSLDNKVFVIQSEGVKSAGRVIEADYTSVGKNGAKVHLWDMQYTPHQTWKFEALIGGINLYYIINQSPKAGKYKYLEAAWTTLDLDGGKVQLWEFNDGVNGRYSAHQVWQVLQNSDGSYSILSAHPKSNGKALEADSFTQQNNGGKIHLYFDIKNQSQVWNLLEDR